jgi:hypothetical protein
VVSGDAVEFRYWDVDLDASDSHDLMDVTKTATAYALFYLDGDRLKVDSDPYPPGAGSSSLPPPAAIIIGPATKAQRAFTKSA